MLTLRYSIVAPQVDLGDGIGQRRKLPLHNLAVHDLLHEGAIRQFLVLRALDNGVLAILFGTLLRSREVAQFLLVRLRLQIV